MDAFSGIILFIVAFYATINFYRIYSLGRKIFHFCLGTAAAFLAIIGVSSFLAEFFPVLDPYFIGEWSSVFSSAFLLSAAGALIRDFKPVFSRFPKSFAFLPLILIAIYPLIIDTVMVKQWALAIFQGSALTISLLIYGFRTYQNSEYGYMLVGVVFFAVTFTLYWLPESVFTMPAYVWMLLVSCGILIITVGYNQVYNLEEQLLDQQVRRETWFV